MIAHSLHLVDDTGFVIDRYDFGPFSQLAGVQVVNGNGDFIAELTIDEEGVVQCDLVEP